MRGVGKCRGRCGFFTRETGVSPARKEEAPYGVVDDLYALQTERFVRDAVAGVGFEFEESDGAGAHEAVELVG